MFTNHRTVSALPARICCVFLPALLISLDVPSVFFSARTIWNELPATIRESNTSDTVLTSARNSPYLSNYPQRIAPLLPARRLPVPQIRLQSTTVRDISFCIVLYCRIVSRPVPHSCHSYGIYGPHYGIFRRADSVGAPS